MQWFYIGVMNGAQEDLFGNCHRAQTFFRPNWIGFEWDGVESKVKIDLMINEIRIVIIPNT